MAQPLWLHSTGAGAGAPAGRALGALLWCGSSVGAEGHLRHGGWASPRGQSMSRTTLGTTRSADVLAEDHLGYHQISRCVSRGPPWVPPDQQRCYGCRGHFVLVALVTKLG
eukprot:superscaffoldBa00000683_g6546